MKDYKAPAFVEYGYVSNITGESGTNGQVDIFTTQNGQLTTRGFTGSIDGCARTPDGQCCWNGTSNMC